MNDLTIPNIDAGIGKRHLVIKYHLDEKNYYIRDLGDGSGTFVRLDVPLVSFLTVHLLFHRYSGTATSYPLAIPIW